MKRCVVRGMPEVFAHIAAAHLFCNGKALDSGKMKGNIMVFHSDLDNTLIYSYKHEIGLHKKCVEIYQGREISYMTDLSWELLKKIQQQTLFVPTTTRTIEQYQRIQLGNKPPEYALVCNGGILLHHGESDSNWYRESRRLVASCQADLFQAEKLLKTDEYVNFEVRNIENLFVFTKSAKPKQTIKRLHKHLEGSQVELFSNGMKVYAVPRKLNKGEAVKRFRHRIAREITVAAGDSRFDIPMLKEADLALARWELQKEQMGGKHVIYLGEKEIFSDEVLKYLLHRKPPKST